MHIIGISHSREECRLCGSLRDLPITHAGHHDRYGQCVRLCLAHSSAVGAFGMGLRSTVVVSSVSSWCCVAQG